MKLRIDCADQGKYVGGSVQERMMGWERSCEALSKAHNVSGWHDNTWQRSPFCSYQFIIVLLSKQAIPKVESKRGRITVREWHVKYWLRWGEINPSRIDMKFNGHKGMDWEGRDNNYIRILELKPIWACHSPPLPFSHEHTFGGRGGGGGCSSGGIWANTGTSDSGAVIQQTNDRPVHNNYCIIRPRAWLECWYFMVIICILGIYCH